MLDKNDSRPPAGSRRFIGTISIVASILLGAGAITSLFGLIHARKLGAYGMLLCFAVLILALSVGSMLCLAVPLVRRLESDLWHRKKSNRRAFRLNSDYVARYSLQDQITALILFIAFGILTAFMMLHARSALVRMTFILVFCCLLAYVVQVTSTSVQFTEERIIAHRPCFGSISEPYTAIEVLQFKPGSIRLRFSDGRWLKLYSGLGDRDLVVEYLRTHCPKSIQLEE